MTMQSKPIRVFFSELSRRFYATRAYRIDDKGLAIVTGEKFDVTNDIAELIKRHEINEITGAPATGYCASACRDLRELADLIRQWGKFELGMSPPAALDYEDAAGKVVAAAAEIERLRANQERMWCKSCGTVTRTGECDCTHGCDPSLQNLVNYADSRQEDIEMLMAENDRLRAAVKFAADWIDPELPAPELYSERTIVAELRATLTVAIATGQTEPTLSDFLDYVTEVYGSEHPAHIAATMFVDRRLMTSK